MLVSGPDFYYATAVRGQRLAMNIIKSAIPEVLIIEPKRIADARGFFSELFHGDRYESAGIKGPFVQDNVSQSGHGVLRGLHLQFPNPQGKLISALAGRILDVIVDVRRGSPSFGRHVSIELSAENGIQAFAPRGFAHGFVVLSEQAQVFYKCDSFYSPKDEIVVRWDDPVLGIDWKVDQPRISPRDQEGLLLADIALLPPYEP
jgi:dTDP-4-dehydrorhamnose 3,5-epimerase